MGETSTCNFKFLTGSEKVFFLKVFIIILKIRLFVRGKNEDYHYSVPCSVRSSRYVHLQPKCHQIQFLYVKQNEFSQTKNELTAPNCVY